MFSSVIPSHFRTKRFLAAPENVLYGTKRVDDNDSAVVTLFDNCDRMQLNWKHTD